MKTKQKNERKNNHKREKEENQNKKCKTLKPKHERSFDFVYQTA